MPSPFPGMDPFLESPRIFPGLHNDLITLLKIAIQARLPPRYYATTEERVWIELSGAVVIPDVDVLTNSATLMSGGKNRETSGVATMEPAEPVVITVPPSVQDEVREVYLEIFAGEHDEFKVVTTIEILSPTNKTAGERSRDLYAAKQRDILASQAHLVEIDLLRGGLHTTAVPWRLLREKCGELDYHICVHRYDSPLNFFVYPAPLENHLPVIEIPLLPADPTIAVDLQMVFAQAYEAGAYNRRLDYADGVETIVPPLRPAALEWARKQLMGNGPTPQTTS